MAIYKYRAQNQSNNTVSGLVEANDEKEAISIVKEKDLKVLSIEKKKSLDFSTNISFGGINRKEIVLFSRQFSVLVSANVSLVQALRIMSSQMANLKFKTIIVEIANEVDAGTRLSDCFAKRKKVFDDFYVSVVRSGETSGKLDEVLTYLADELEKDYDMMAKIKGAMIYPAVIISGLTIVGFSMMIFVVPQLTAILEEAGAELPLATRILMFTSKFLASFWWALLILAIGLVIGLRFFLKTDRGRVVFDNLLIRLPIFGPLFKNIYLVRFTRSMNTLLLGGVNISKSLKVAADIVDNKVFKDLILETQKEVEEGNSIALVFSKSRHLPSMVSEMMVIGEQTGRLDMILAKITEFYTKEVTNTITNLMTLIEPIVMAVIGVAVGLMVAAIIMPMYNLSSAI